MPKTIFTLTRTVKFARIYRPHLALVIREHREAFNFRLV